MSDFEVSIAINLIFLVVLLWQRKYLTLAIQKQINRQNGQMVRIYHKDRTFTDHIVKDVKNFNPNKNGLKRLTDATPEFIDKNKIPNTPFSRDRRTNFGSYEFDEDSKDCIDPYQRIPDQKNKELESQQLLEAYETGALEERIKSKSKFNVIILMILILNLCISGAIIKTMNDQSESFKPFMAKVSSVVDRVNIRLDAEKPIIPETTGSGSVKVGEVK